MSLVKSNKRQTPMWGRSLFASDPFFSSLVDPRRGMFNFLNDDDFDSSPAINIKDHEKGYEIELAAPGLNKEDFKVSLDDGILTISAEKQSKIEEENEGYLKKEFSYNSFSRAMSIPETIDQDKEIKAQYKDGVLKMMLQKKDGVKSVKNHKTIKIT